MSLAPDALVTFPAVAPAADSASAQTSREEATVEGERRAEARTARTSAAHEARRTATSADRVGASPARP